MGTITGKFHQNPLKTVGGVAETTLCLRTDGLTDGRTHYYGPPRLTSRDKKKRKMSHNLEIYFQTCAPSKASEQSMHSHRVVITCNGRVFDSQGRKVYSCEQRRLWSDCAKAQADMSVRWALMSKGTISGVGVQFFSRLNGFDFLFCHAYGQRYIFAWHCGRHCKKMKR